MNQRPRSHRLARTVLGLLVLLTLLTTAPALGVGQIVVSTLGVTDGVVELARGGSVQQRIEDTDRDGVLSLSPRAAGSYQITITAGGQSDTVEVQVGRIGTVSITFDPSATAGNRAVVEEITRVEVITVTGLRIDQELQDVSAAITAITADEIEELGADDFVDYARTVPAINFADLGSNRNEINIRGMGKLTAGTATVGVYVDDIAIADSFNNPDLKLFDVQQIEVLRGPQGTLYGESSMGGAIRLVTAKADPSGLAFKFDGTLSDTQGGGENTFGNVMVNFPAPRDKFAVRVVGYTRDEDGWIDTNHAQDANSSDADGVRISGRWLASDRAILTVSGITQDTEVGAQNFTTEGLGDLEAFTAVPEHDTEDYQQATLSFVYQFDWAQLESITGLVERDYDRDIDFGFLVDFTSDQKVLSQELRLSSSGEATDWVAGLYYKKSDQDNALVAPDLFGPGVDFGNFIEFNTENLSAFGQVTRAFSDKWSGTLGARIFEEDKNDPFTQTIGDFVFDESNLESSADAVLPKVAISFTPNADLLTYVSIATGYRSGGVNPIITMNPDAPPTYDEDTNVSYEIGIKKSALDNRLIFNTALFRVDWKDMQISGTPQDSALGYTTNAGDAHTAGIELELLVAPIPGLEISAGGTLLEAELDEPAEGGVKGSRLPHTVEEAFNLGVQYSFPLSQAFDGVVRGDVQNRGDAFSDVLNRDIDATDSYTLGNLRFGIEGDRWGAFLFWNNIGDERAELVRFNSGISVYRNQPETIGLTFRVQR